MKAFKWTWQTALAYLLAAFFLIGSIGNIISPPPISADYARWGYPNWFHYITGSLELTTAIALATMRFRFWGAALGCAVMIGALLTLVLHGEYLHAIAPLVVFILLAVAANGFRSQPA